jgi:hypothetical protein
MNLRTLPTPSLHFFHLLEYQACQVGDDSSAQISAHSHVLTYSRAAALTRLSTFVRVCSRIFSLSQLLEYQACKAEGDADCQFYKRHHDYIDTDREMNQVECE